MEQTISLKQKPVLLAILDGWGIGKHNKSDAVFLAKTPQLNHLLATYPHTRLVTNGLDVGLPRGIMGNSEVGHQNIGAGRIVYQQLTAINLAIENGSFFKNPAIHAAYEHAKTHGTALHILGLLSDGGVHSDCSHLFALLRKAKDMNLSDVYIHVILDGRDTPPNSGKDYLNTLLEQITSIGVGKIASLCGRYYAMDRDNNYARVKLAYDAIVHGKGFTAED
ncbi:MAG: 2,3-bisphosphoglycerate-independent phosphoglycerate mutase, partial [Candidatus Margulisiibacteriota bacterium]